MPGYAAELKAILQGGKDKFTPAWTQRHISVGNSRVWLQHHVYFFYGCSDAPAGGERNCPGDPCNRLSLLFKILWKNDPDAVRIDLAPFHGSRMTAKMLGCSTQLHHQTIE